MSLKAAIVVQYIVIHILPFCKLCLFFNLYGEIAVKHKVYQAAFLFAAGIEANYMYVHGEHYY